MISKMSINQSYRILLYILLIVAVLSVGACSGINPGDDPETESTAVKVEAAICNTLQSRKYQAEGQVEDGIYNLTFPTTTNNVYNVGEVQFGKDDEHKQIGFVTLPGNVALKWLVVGGGSTPTLYLDNIPRTHPGADNSTTVTFSVTDNPYVAAPFDSIDGNNDLLWGARTFQRNAGTLHFDLQHAMARVRLMITTDNTNGEIDLTDATVKITRLNQTPLSFDRLEGTLALNTDDIENYTDLVFVDPDDEDRDWLQDYSPDANKHVYQSPDFVLPPQELLQDNNRPQLIITLKDGVSYSGILPSAMLISNEDYAETSYPVALSFLSQYVLTIRTVITEEPPSLSFMPVYVMKWVDKGTFDEEAHQSGIYTVAEFMKLINYYKDGNVFQLDRYGKQKDVDGTPVWHFDFWHGITLDYNDIHGKMPYNEQAGDFVFVFNNYSVSVKYDDGDTRAVSPDELRRIVTGN